MEKNPTLKSHILNQNSLTLSIKQIPINSAQQKKNHNFSNFELNR
jgi:hypothetical protein